MKTIDIQDFNYSIDKTNELFELLEKYGIVIKPAEQLVIHNFIVSVLNKYKK